MNEHDFVTALVDSETAIDFGVPGFDALHAAVSWSEPAMVRSGATGQPVAAGFEAAGSRSPFFVGAREAEGESAAAAGVPNPLHEAVIAVFSARRVGRRSLRAPFPGAPAVTVARRILDAMCR